MNTQKRIVVSEKIQSFISVLDRRDKELETGAVRGESWEEVKKRAKLTQRKFRKLQ